MLKLHSMASARLLARPSCPRRMLFIMRSNPISLRLMVSSLIFWAYWKQSLSQLRSTMSTTETDQFTTYIARIAEETRSGKMEWVKTNPTTFIWTKMSKESPEAQLTLQKIIKKKAVRNELGGFRIINQDHYVFRAVEIPEGVVRLTVNSEQTTN